jgi:hypothetical protein
MRTLPIFLALSAAACGRPADGAERESRATLSGTIQFRDALVDAEGTHHDPATPDGLRGALTVTVDANADVDDTCPDAQARQLRAAFTGEFVVANGRFTSALYPAGLTTPSGCAVTRVDTHAVNDVRIDAALAVSPQTCSALCGGAARADADQRCSGVGDRAECRGGIEPGVAGSCYQACSQAQRVTGVGQLNIGTLPSLSGDDLATGRLGDLEANIVLDRVQ